MNKLIYLLSFTLLFAACNSENETPANSDKVQGDKFENLKESVEGDLTCAYEMKRIISAPSGGFMLTSGYRACQDEIISNEVIAFEKSEGLGDKLSNVYVSEDLRPIDVKFEAGKLIISHYFDSIPLLKETSIYETEIVYQTSEQ